MEEAFETHRLLLERELHPSIISHLEQRMDQRLFHSMKSAIGNGPLGAGWQGRLVQFVSKCNTEVWWFYSALQKAGLSHVARLLKDHKDVHHKTMFKKLVTEGFYDIMELGPISLSDLVKQDMLRLEDIDAVDACPQTIRALQMIQCVAIHCINWPWKLETFAANSHDSDLKHLLKVLNAKDKTWTQPCENNPGLHEDVACHRNVPEREVEIMLQSMDSLCDFCSDADDALPLNSLSLYPSMVSNIGINSQDHSCNFPHQFAGPETNNFNVHQDNEEDLTPSECSEIETLDLESDVSRHVWFERIPSPSVDFRVLETANHEVQRLKALLQERMNKVEKMELLVEEKLQCISVKEAAVKDQERQQDAKAKALAKKEQELNRKSQSLEDRRKGLMLVENLQSKAKDDINQQNKTFRIQEENIRAMEGAVSAKEEMLAERETQTIVWIESLEETTRRLRLKENQLSKKECKFLDEVRQQSEAFQIQKEKLKETESVLSAREKAIITWEESVGEREGKLKERIDEHAKIEQKFHDEVCQQKEALGILEDHLRAKEGDLSAKENALISKEAELGIKETSLEEKKQNLSSLEERNRTTAMHLIQTLKSIQSKVQRLTKIATDFACRNQHDSLKEELSNALWQQDFPGKQEEKMESEMLKVQESAEEIAWPMNVVNCQDAAVEDIPNEPYNGTSHGNKMSEVWTPIEQNTEAIEGEPTVSEVEILLEEDCDTSQADTLQTSTPKVGTPKEQNRETGEARSIKKTGTGVGTVPDDIETREVKLVWNLKTGLERGSPLEKNGESSQDQPAMNRLPERGIPVEQDSKISELEPPPNQNTAAEGGTPVEEDNETSQVDSMQNHNPVPERTPIKEDLETGQVEAILNTMSSGEIHTEQTSETNQVDPIQNQNTGPKGRTHTAEDSETGQFQPIQDFKLGGELNIEKTSEINVQSEASGRESLSEKMSRTSRSDQIEIEPAAPEERRTLKDDRETSQVECQDAGIQTYSGNNQVPVFQSSQSGTFATSTPTLYANKAVQVSILPEFHPRRLLDNTHDNQTHHLETRQVYSRMKMEFTKFGERVLAEYYSTKMTMEETIQPLSRCVQVTGDVVECACVQYGQTECLETPLKRAQGQADEQETPLKHAQGQADEQETPLKRAQGQVDEQETPVKHAQGQADEQETPLKRAQGQVYEQETPLKHAQGQGDEQETPLKHAQDQDDEQETPLKRAQGQADATAGIQRKGTLRKGFSISEWFSLQLNLTVHDWGSCVNAGVRQSFDALMYDSQPQEMDYYAMD